MKVVHDFRASADLLYHQYGLELINVFDTMAAHIMVTNWVVETKVTRAKRLYCLVMDYLGVVSPGHRITREAHDEGGQELPLPPSTLIHLGTWK